MAEGSSATNCQSSVHIGTQAASPCYVEEVKATACGSAVSGVVGTVVGHARGAVVGRLESRQGRHRLVNRSAQARIRSDLDLERGIFRIPLVRDRLCSMCRTATFGVEVCRRR